MTMFIQAQVQQKRKQDTYQSDKVAQKFVQEDKNSQKDSEIVLKDNNNEEGILIEDSPMNEDYEFENYQSKQEKDIKVQDDEEDKKEPVIDFKNLKIPIDKEELMKEKRRQKLAVDEEEEDPRSGAFENIFYLITSFIFIIIFVTELDLTG